MESAIFCVCKGPDYILDFADCRVSAYNSLQTVGSLLIKTATDKIMNGHGYAPIKLYRNKQLA